MREFWSDLENLRGPNEKLQENVTLTKETILDLILFIVQMLQQQVLHILHLYIMTIKLAL